MTAFLVCVEEAKKGERSQPIPYSEVAFNNYLKWFQGVTRLELCEHAYDAEILEEPIVFEELAQARYNMLVRQGTSTPFASSLNFMVMCMLVCHFQTHCRLPYMFAIFSS